MAGALGERIGSGGSAEVFEYGSGTVLKLYRPRYGYAAEMEAERTRAVHEAGIPAPRLIQVVEVDTRRGIVLERIEGRTLLEDARLLAAEPENPDATELRLLVDMAK